MDVLVYVIVLGVFIPFFPSVIAVVDLAFGSAVRLGGFFGVTV